MTPPADLFPSGSTSFPLLIHRLLDRPLRWTHEKRIFYRSHAAYSYQEFYQRVQQLAHALTALGVRPGDRVGIMDWDSHRYLECFFAVPMLGAVLHTINVRLSPEQTLYTIQHAGDRVLLVHPDFLPLLEPLAPRLTDVQAYIALPEDGPLPESSISFAGRYEELLAAAPADFKFPELDEDTVATLFYTTGTTGDPKGVFFSHRQIVLHTLAAGLGLATVPEPVTFRADDVYLPLTPMFHVHAWGVPYIATLMGVTQVYPGKFEPPLILHLMSHHRVTFSHCVPTILQMLLHHPAAVTHDWSSLKVIIGGSALPQGLAREAGTRGIRVMAGYGLSETCPIVSLAHVKPEDTGASADRRIDISTRAGFPVPLIQPAIANSEDQVVTPPTDATGELLLRGPWLTRGYFRDAERSRHLWRGDWLHTGDVARIDRDGYLRITDRIKDVIKIGGEWISSLELENALSQHPAVSEVAVIAVQDSRWDERPHAEVVLRPAERDHVNARDLVHFLRSFIDRGTLHKRAVLTEVRIVDAIPKTSVGKINKRALRDVVKSRASGSPG